MSVTEMIMLRQMSVVITLNKIKNEYLRFKYLSISSCCSQTLFKANFFHITTIYRSQLTCRSRP